MSRSPPSNAEQPNPAPSSTTPSYDPVGIFWDYENCAPPTHGSGYNIVDNIRTLASQFGAVNLFKTYLQLPGRSSQRQFDLRSELQSCGLSLTDCPHNGKNSVDLMMIVDIMAFIKDNPPPATVILISGDRDFAYLLSTVRWRRYNVVLISNSSMTHRSLTAQANITYDWKSDILNPRPPFKPLLPGSQTLSSNASLTTPQGSDNLPKSDARALSRPNEDTAPVIRPPTPPPSLANTVPIGAPQPPMAGTPTKTASASIPMSTASDSWIEADWAGGSTMDPVSPKAADLIDESYSPAFSSPELTLSKGERDIPSSPGRLLLIDEESSATQGLTYGHQVESTSCEPSAPPTEVVPPLQLPPTHENPSNAPPPTLTPNTPRLPWAEVAKSLLEADAKRGFEDLIAILSELSAYGDTAPRSSTILSLWGDREPDAFEAVSVMQFKAYLQLAESAGIVTLEQGQGKDRWVILRSQWETDSDVDQGDGWDSLSIQSSKSSWGGTVAAAPPPVRLKGGGVDAEFVDLVEMMGVMWRKGEKKPALHRVGTKLSQDAERWAWMLNACGVRKFKAYAELAKNAGIVEICGQPGDETMSLHTTIRLKAGYV